MLTVISGEWGTGKTKFMVEIAEKAWNRGEVNITNFRCAIAHLDWSKDPIDVFLWKLGMVVEMKMNGIQFGNLFPMFRLNTVNVFIDEGNLYFNPETQKRAKEHDEYTYNRFLTLLAQVRKLNINIYVTCQTIGRLGKDLRRVADDYINVVWVVNLPYYVYKEDNRSHTIRPELRQRLRVQWVEHHMVDEDDPTFNYTRTVDPNTGFYVNAPKSTLTRRPVMHWDYGKDYLFKLYHSFEPIGVRDDSLKSVDTSTVDYSFILKELCYIPTGFRKEHFPTFKKFFKFFIRSIKLNDEVLPTKIFFKDLAIPTEQHNPDFDSQLMRQELLTVDSQPIKEHVLKALYTRKPINQRTVVRIARGGVIAKPQKKPLKTAAKSRSDAAADDKLSLNDLLSKVTV